MAARHKMGVVVWLRLGCLFSLSRLVLVSAVAQASFLCVFRVPVALCVVQITSTIPVRHSFYSQATDWVRIAFEALLYICLLVVLSLQASGWNWVGGWLRQHSDALCEGHQHTWHLVVLRVRSFDTSVSICQHASVSIKHSITGRVVMPVGVVAGPCCFAGVAGVCVLHAAQLLQALGGAVLERL